MMNPATSINLRTRRSKADGSRSRRPRLSWALTASVVGLQAGLLLTLAITSLWDPPRVRAIESLWVWVQRVSVFPWLMLLIGGPALSWLACRLDRRRLLPLALAWAGFGVTLVMVFGVEAQRMLRWLWAYALG